MEAEEDEEELGSFAGGGTVGVGGAYGGVSGGDAWVVWAAWESL